MQFRQATPRDLMDALAGWREANGSGKAAIKPPTRAELEDLKARYS